jgi:hypothetical protein
MTVTDARTTWDQQNFVYTGQMKLQTQHACLVGPNDAQHNQTSIPSIPDKRERLIVMGCTASSMRSGRRHRGHEEDHDVSFKLGTAVVKDSIRMMIERDGRQRANSTTPVENSGYRPRAPHPLMSSCRQVTVVMESEDETIAILKDDFMSSNNSTTLTHNDEDDAGCTTVAPLRTSPILPEI